MLITPAEYEDVLDTYFIVDCAIRYRNVFGFALDREMVWFEDRAWATSENGLWTIRDGRVEFQNHLLAPEISVCSGNLYVADGVMLMAGLGGACFRENGQWHSIFTAGQMGKLLLDAK